MRDLNFEVIDCVQLNSSSVCIVFIDHVQAASSSDDKQSVFRPVRRDRIGVLIDMRGSARTRMLRQVPRSSQNVQKGTISRVVNQLYEEGYERCSRRFSRINSYLFYKSTAKIGDCSHTRWRYVLRRPTVIELMKIQPLKWSSGFIGLPWELITILTFQLHYVCYLNSKVLRKTEKRFEEDRSGRRATWLPRWFESAFHILDRKM